MDILMMTTSFLKFWIKAGSFLRIKVSLSTKI